MASDGRAEFDPSEIARVDFPTAFRGYDQDAVRRYLTRLAAAVSRAQELGLLGTVDPEQDDARVMELELEAERLRGRVAELEHELGSTSGRIQALEREVEAATSRANALAANPASSAPLDEAELISKLGQETARVLETARSAAADIVHRAENDAASIKHHTEVEARSTIEEAQATLAAARTEAGQIMAEAAAEVARMEADTRAEISRAQDEARRTAEHLVAQANAQADQELTDARAEAQRVRSTADAEAQRVRTTADAEAESRLESARAEADKRLSEARAEAEQRVTAARLEADDHLAGARSQAERELTEARTEAERERSTATALAGRMVGDAEEMRTELLGDLVVRRRMSREQLVVMNAARDRLAVALASARNELDDVASVLQRATPVAEELDLRDVAQGGVGDGIEPVARHDLDRSQRAEVSELVALLDRRGGTAAGSSGPADTPALAGATAAVTSGTAAVSNGNGSVVNGSVVNGSGVNNGAANGAVVNGAVVNGAVVNATAGGSNGTVSSVTGTAGTVSSAAGTVSTANGTVSTANGTGNGAASGSGPVGGGGSETAPISIVSPGTGPVAFRSGSGPGGQPGSSNGSSHGAIVNGTSGGHTNGTNGNGNGQPGANGSGRNPAGGPATGAPRGPKAFGFGGPGAGQPGAPFVDGPDSMDPLLMGGSAGLIPDPTGNLISGLHADATVEMRALDGLPMEYLTLEQLNALPVDDQPVPYQREVRAPRFGSLSPAAPGQGLGATPGSLHRTATRGDLPRNTPYAGTLPAAFEGRDIALTRATPGFRRRLKRAVNDDQSEVLERLRAGRGPVTGLELPPFDDQLDAYIEALRPVLFDVVTSGAEILGCLDIPVPEIESLCLQLARHIVDCVRTPAESAIERAATSDREAILDPVRAIYRDFRNGTLPDLIEDALHEAFALGLYHAIEPSDHVLWITDPRLDPDPICEDNSASKALLKGTNFPSGHPRPLSMPGCRCLLIPAG